MYPELEININKRGACSYAFQLRLRNPNEESDHRMEYGPVAWAPDDLSQFAQNATKYGETLSSFLFGSDDVLQFYTAAKTLSQNMGMPLRVRLCIDRWSHELHGLRWESLMDPISKVVLSTQPDVYFSRFLGSYDMRPVKLRAKSDLRVFTAIANPSDLEDWEPNGVALAPIDRSACLERIRSSLGEIDCVSPAEGRLTVDSLLEGILGDYDVIHLVCHGAFVDGEARLWFEGNDGKSQIVSGTELLQYFSRNLHLPRMVILSSCQSAGAATDSDLDNDQILSALGPRLAEIGISAVLAMQGNVLQTTADKFIETFFKELRVDGQLDRSAMEARFAVRDQVDFWAPVLFTRLTKGRLWYEQRFASDDDFEIWDGLIEQLEEGCLIPILGPGLVESYVGASQDVARGWAEMRDYPMATSQFDLHAVAQYVSTTQGKFFAFKDYARYLREGMEQRWEGLDGIGEGKRENERVLECLSRARELNLPKMKIEPHEVLANLECPLYLSTNYDNLLIDALKEKGRSAVVHQTQWTKQDTEPEELAMPTAESPMVEQLFGSFENKKTMVLTEDDYFEYMIGVTRLQQRPQPSVVMERITDSGLMFLGFKIDSWQFRVLIHLLQSLQGSKLRGFYKNVAVQLDPEDGRGADLDRARKYLEKYFGAPAMQIEIYWGSAEDFLAELDKRKS